MGIADACSNAGSSHDATKSEKSYKRKRNPVSYADTNDGGYAPSHIDLKPPAGHMIQSTYDALPEEPPKKKGKKKAKDEGGNVVAEEKRPKRFRQKAPRTYLEIKSRAMSQRMTLLDRVRGGTEELPNETIKIAGTTGNVYTVAVQQVPNCDCPHAKKGNQCKHIIYVMLRALKAPENIAYQLALTPSELRSLIAKAPPIPSADANAADSDGSRKPIEDDCPICCMEFVPDQEEIVYCKASCGNNIHKTCFQQWAATKHGGKVTCPFCRTEWQADDPSLKDIKLGGPVNDEGYVNVAMELGLSGERDYSTYHQPWVNQSFRRGYRYGGGYSERRRR